MSNRVQSNRDPVELRSQQLRNSELELLWDPEWHIRKHDRCRRHLDFSMLNSICSQCQSVILYVTSRFSHHHGCYVENGDCDDVLTFVEMPKSPIATRQSSNDIWKTLPVDCGTAVQMHDIFLQVVPARRLPLIIR